MQLNKNKQRHCGFTNSKIVTPNRHSITLYIHCLNCLNFYRKRTRTNTGYENKETLTLPIILKAASPNAFIHSLVFSLEGRDWQEPEPSHVTGIVLAHCILGKFLGVVGHCFPPPLDVPTLAARCLLPQ